MANLSQIYKYSKFALTSGAVKEYLPLITNGLVAFFPFDGESKGFLGDASTRLSATGETDTTNSYKEGLGIGDSTINLVSTLTAVWNPWGGIVGTSDSNTNFYLRNGVHVNVTTSGGSGVYTTNNINLSASTTYTISATLKIISGTPSANLFYVREYRSIGTQITEHGEYTSANMIYLQNDWYKVWATFTTNVETVRIDLMGYEYTAGVEYMLEDIQVELGSVFTPYVLGTRSAASTATFPISGNLTTYTILGNFMPHSPLYNGYALTANQSLLFTIQDLVGSGDAQYRYYSPTISNPFIELSGNFGATNNHSAYDILANQELYFAITKTGTSFVCKLYQGGWKPAHNATLTNNTQLSTIVLGGATPVWNGDHRDLLVYDRVLTDAELNLIISEKEVYRSNGDLGCYINEDINPNLWGNTDFATTSYTVTNGGTTTFNTDASYGTYHQMVLSGAISIYRGYDIVTTSGDTYVFSGWFWLSSGNTFEYAVLVIENATSSSGSIYCNTLATNQWVYAQMSCVSDGNIRCLIYPKSGGAGAGTIKWRNISVKKLISDDTRLNNYGELEVADFSE